MPQRWFEVDKADYPWEPNWFERDGTHMHYIDVGEGLPIVMCHGSPTWSFVYRNVIKRMQNKFRCIAVDLPGFGYSEHPPGYDYKPASHAGWLEALLVDHLQLDKFIIICQDWGGPIGMTVATRHPDRVVGAVISSTWAWYTETRVLKMASKTMGSWLGQILILKRNLTAKRIMPALLPKPLRKPEVLNAYTAPFPTPESRMGMAIFPRELLGSKEFLSTLENNLYKLKDKPVEFIWGLKDVISSKEWQDRWLSHFPDAGAQRLPDVNHFTQEDAPESYELALDRIRQKITE